MSEDLSKKAIPRALFDFIYMNLQISWGDKKQVNFTKLSKVMAEEFLEKYPDTKDLESLARNLSKFMTDYRMADNQTTFTMDGDKGILKSHSNNCPICFTNKKLKEKYGPQGAGCWWPALIMRLLRKIKANIAKIEWDTNEKPKTGECIQGFTIHFRK
ncbi:MAG: hypothetical protein ACTSVY_00560 [Candidatus Helarchaeota archaeon]